MCNPINAGGRRCPVHLQITAAYRRDIQKQFPGLKTNHVNELFRELRREGIRAEDMTETYQAHQSEIARYRANFETDVEAAAGEDRELDNATMYALTQLHERAARRNEQFQERFRRAATMTGHSIEDITIEFDIAYAAARKEGVKAHLDKLTPEAVTALRDENLPHDAASIIAFHAIHDIENSTLAPRHFDGIETGNPAFTNFTHHEGRVQYITNGETRRYRNIPQSVVDTTLATGSPAALNEWVHANPDSRYRDSAEAEVDSYTVRCDSCGQYAGRLQHACPGQSSSVNDVIAASGLQRYVAPKLTTEQQRKVLPQTNIITSKDHTYVEDLTTEQYQQMTPDSAQKVRALINTYKTGKTGVLDRITAVIQDDGTVQLINAERATSDDNDRLVFTENPAEVPAPQQADHTPTNHELPFDTQAWTLEEGAAHAKILLHTAEPETLHAALITGEPVRVPIKAALERSLFWTQDVDAHGYELHPLRQSSGNVEGSVVIRLQPDGSIETLSSPRTLKCDCENYQRYYYCHHTSFMHRNAATNMQTLIPHTRYNETTQQYEEVESPFTNQYAQESEPYLETRVTEAGITYYSVAKEPGDDLTMYEEDATNVFVPQHPLLQADANLMEASPEDIREAAKELQLINSITEVSDFHSENIYLDNLLNEQPIGLPVRVEFGNSFQRVTPVVTGEMVYAKGTYPPAVMEYRLKCECVEYREKYDCVHVRLLRQQPHLAARYWDDDMDYDMEEMRAVIAEAEMFADEAEKQGVSLADIAAQHEEYKDSLNESVDANTEAQTKARKKRLRSEQYVTEQTRAGSSLSTRELIDEYYAMRGEECDTYLLERDRAHENGDPAYTADTFHEDYMEAKKLKGTTQILPPLEAGFSEGIFNPDNPGSRSFGIELEFVLPEENRDRALALIGADLHMAGLTNTTEQEGYGNASNHQDGYDKWSFEEDDTVHGEIVSPILQDTPETWAQVQQVIDIVKRHGGDVNGDTGSHVHVSSGSYRQSYSKYQSLVNMGAEQADTLIRMSANPRTNYHRGFNFCNPNIAPERSSTFAEEIADHKESSRQVSTAARVLRASHGDMINVGHGSGTIDNAHIEMRSYDGTLDLGVIQRQVLLSGAMVDAAERRSIKQGGFKMPSTNYEESHDGSIGHGRELAAEHPGNTPEALEVHTHRTAAWFSEMLATRSSRKHLTELFAVTAWQGN